MSEGAQLWTPRDYLVDGEFASASDIRSALELLAAADGGPVFAIAFSNRYALRSLAFAKTSDPSMDQRLIHDVCSKVNSGLKETENKFEYVSECVREAMRVAGSLNPRTKCFGSRIELPGRLAVVVCGDRVDVSEIESAATAVAVRILSSRPAHFSLTTSLELAGLSEIRNAAKRARPKAPSLQDIARTESAQTIAEFGSMLLGASGVIAYEADRANPHRFTYLESAAEVVSDELRQVSWIPVTVGLTPKLEIPTPPELGGSQFDHLGELVELCVESGGKSRMLVGTIAGRFSALAVPYGFDNLRRLAVGVVSFIWSDSDERRLGTYELAASRMIALHLGRSYESRLSAETVQLVTSQLDFISQLPTKPGEAGLLGLDDALSSRRDVSLFSSTLGQTLGGLVKISGAMSATCRLITGADGPNMSRYLARVHCEGDECATASPSRIPLSEASASVNAWVARTGRAVYLRKFDIKDDAGARSSADLEAYPGLDSVRIDREGVESELCVPIVAEGRLVGTVNLESDVKYGFDSVGETVAEYAQLIGIALLESRRRIGVETVTEIEGFLDYRHQLDTGLKDLGTAVSSEDGIDEKSRIEYARVVDDLRQLVYMRRIPFEESLPADSTIGQAIRAAMGSIKWSTYHVPLEEQVVDPWSDTDEEISQMMIGADAARALAFAVAQALHNVRVHGGGGARLAGRDRLAMFRFGELEIGGRRSGYVSVSSTCKPQKFAELDHQKVFRQPIEREDRVSLGAFLAGEALRRCGGSAFLRVTPSVKHDYVVDAEFGVPAL